MDNRFPKILRIIISRLDFIAIPNLGLLISGLAVLGFVGSQGLGAPLERFIFDPELVLQGEWWRLFAFPIFQDPLWLLFFVMYAYFAIGMLETSWGSAPLTIFTLLSYGAAIGASFAAGYPLAVWTHVMENISLAFGTLFPEMEFYLFFILPVKAKWLAFFAGGVFLFQFLTGSMAMKLFLLMVLSPYLLFFGPYLIKELRLKLKSR